LQKLILHKYGPKIIDMFQHGRLPNGKEITDPRQIDAYMESLTKEKLPGISRYFIGQR